MYGHSTQELAYDVENTPLGEHRQCANCAAPNCVRVVDTGAPNTAFSFAAALTCGGDVCRDKVRDNMQMMADAAADLDAEVTPAEGYTADMLRQKIKDNGGFWARTLAKHTSKLGTSVFNVLMDMKDRPIVQDMLKKVSSDPAFKALINKQNVKRAVTLMLPSKETLERVVSRAGGKLTEELTEKLMTSVMALTPKALPIKSLGRRRSEIKVADINPVTATGITLRAESTGMLRVRLPALAAMAGLPENTLWKVGEIVDASNGRVMVMEPTDMN
jgi:hypothetical protein